MSSNTVRVSVELSPDAKVATVRVGNAAPAVCKALGIDRDQDGTAKVIYLDRYVHKLVRGRDFEGWVPSGAITTILTRAPERPRGGP